MQRGTLNNRGGTMNHRAALIWASPGQLVPAVLVVEQFGKDEREVTMATNELMVKQQTESTNHLKSVFEQSLAVLQDDNNAAMRKTRPNKPARRDCLPLYIDPANLRKRALEDAAKALAALWRISQPGRGKLTARGLSFHKS